jgi:hypothetical protein
MFNFKCLFKCGLINLSFVDLVSKSIIQWKQEFEKIFNKYRVK